MEMINHFLHNILLIKKKRMKCKFEEVKPNIN